MFGIGFLELCVIGVVVLIFVGPQRMPDLMRQAGRLFVQVRRMSNEVRSTMNTVVRDAEAEMDLGMKKAQEPKPAAKDERPKDQDS